MDNVIRANFASSPGDPLAEAPGNRRIAPAPSAPRLQSTGGRRGEYGVGDLARELNLMHFSTRAVIQKLRALARLRGLPLPRTPRVVKDDVITGPSSIHARSRWDAGEVDAWLEGSGPPPAAPVAAAAPRPLPRPARDELIARARAVFGNVA